MASYEELENMWEIGLVFPNGERLYAQQLASVEDYDCDDPFDVYAVDSQGELIAAAGASAGDGFVNGSNIDWRGVIDAASNWDDMADEASSEFHRLADELDEAEIVDDPDELYSDVFEPVV
jgi:hypothetical protein